MAQRQSNAINLCEDFSPSHHQIFFKYNPFQLNAMLQCCLSLLLSHLMPFPPWHHNSIWLHTKPGLAGMPERFTCSLQMPTFFLCPGLVLWNAWNFKPLVVEYSHLLYSGHDKLVMCSYSLHEPSRTNLEANVMQMFILHPASLARSSASSRAFLAWSCLKYLV